MSNTPRYRPGGKYAPERNPSTREEELNKASTTISTVVGGGSGSANEEQASAPGIQNLTSTLWSELL